MNLRCAGIHILLNSSVAEQSGLDTITTDCGYFKNCALDLSNILSNSVENS